MRVRDSAKIEEQKAEKFDELLARSRRNSTPESQRVRESLNLLCDKETRDALKVLRKEQMKRRTTWGSYRLGRGAEFQ
jgi:hypothetical protein